MPSPAWENLDDFLNVDDFATTATFTNSDGQVSQPVACIFDDPYFDKQLGEYSATEGEPRITCKEVDVVGVKKHHECTIASMPGRTYHVVHDVKFDGTGTCVVYLAEN
ncbi:head-tail joining protein [Bradyrhizobium yuanmingense]|uniref:head-tail joining protein n=1 Tax=Bradyrhizobium yuanmingense TaxID=108015 RepID=UPI0004B7DFD3|nr:hypothetical protein [Bradyrhizobium yuanmingense]